MLSYPPDSHSMIKTTGGPSLLKKMPDPSRPIEKLSRIKVVLPPPGKLAIEEKTIKVTLMLSKSSVLFLWWA